MRRCREGRGLNRDGRGGHTDIGASEMLIYFPEVECGDILGPGFEILDRHCKKYPNSSREQSGLYARLVEVRRWIGTKELTKMRIPSASFCQRVAILLSSSSAIFEYILKRGREPSERGVDSPFV